MTTTVLVTALVITTVCSLMSCKRWPHCKTARKGCRPQSGTSRFSWFPACCCTPAWWRHCGATAELEQQHDVNVTFSEAERQLCVTRNGHSATSGLSEEALTNALRHARARTIGVTMTATNECVTLSVADDGIGFVASEHARTGLGLRSMDERGRLAHGDLTVESSPGHGTATPLEAASGA